MTIEHNSISDPYIHEPKGISTATADEVYVADGLGSGVWSLPKPYGSNTANAGEYPISLGGGNITWIKNPFGFVYFENIATPYTLSYPAAYTKLNPTTTAPGVSYKVTEGTNARLTYIGPGEVMDMSCNISLDHAAGADRDLQLSMYKNGVIVPGSVAIITASSSSKRFITLSAAALFATNDYIEVYAKNNGASGDIRVYTFTMFLDPH